MKRISYQLFVLLSTAIFAVACHKESNTFPVTKAEIALTFDDNNIDNWYDYLPLLDSLHLRCTFYICRYHEFTSAQKNKLQALAAHGNEIAYHTTHHLDLSKALQKNGLSQVMEKEIDPDLTLMQNDGFAPVDFAYPFGSHVPELDVALGRKFKTIRAVSNKQNWFTCLVKSSGDGVLHSAGIDQNAGISDEEITEILDRAVQSHDCAVFTAHKIISTKTPFHVSRQRLLLLCSEAAKRHLAFVTVQDLRP